MKKPITIILGLIQILTFQSCKAQNTKLDGNAIQILNLIIPKNDSICLIKESYYSGNSKQPENLIDHYFRVYSYNIMKENDSVKNSNVAYKIFLKDVDGTITIKELNEMKTRYTAWSLREWKQTEIKNKNVHLISINDKENKCRKIYRISEPLYTADKMKAIIKVHSSINKTGGTVLTILKKEKGKWKIIGGIPIGTSG